MRTQTCSSVQGYSLMLDQSELKDLEQTRYIFHMINLEVSTSHLQIVPRLRAIKNGCATHIHNNVRPTHPFQLLCATILATINMNI